MTLSAILITLLPLFFLPPFFLPHNKIRVYTLCATIAGIPVLVLYLLNLFFPDWNLSTSIGTIFLPFSSFLYGNRVELGQGQLLHLSTHFFYLYLYAFVYLITYIITKINFIGANPAIHKPISIIRQVFDTLLFFTMTYGLLFFFLIDIRILFPFGDGLLSPLMNQIYRIGV